MPMTIKLLCGWLFILLLAPILSNGRVAVYAPNLVQTITASDSQIVSGGFFMIVESPSVWRLYKNGAWLVLPAKTGGCLSLRG